MSLNVAVKYRLYDNKKAVLVFYIVVLSIYAFMFLFSALIKDNAEFKGSIQGMELASAIFLFVAGLNSFKEVFRMFMQNGMSRKTMFISNIISTLVICSVMALIDSALALVSRNITAVNSGIYSSGMLELMYGRYINGIGNFLISLLLCFFIYATFSAVGFFITTLYYRMNKGLKITVSIGVPAVLFVIAPLIDTLLLKGAVFAALAKITGAAFSSPFMCMLSCFILFVLITVLSWFLVRKAIVKD